MKSKYFKKGLFVLTIGLLCILAISQVKAEVNEYDFSRKISIDLDGGSSFEMTWRTVVDRDGDFNEAGKWFFNSLGEGETCRDREGVEHTIEGFDDNEWPDDGTFYQHTDCVGVTPHAFIMEPEKEGYTFLGWDTNTEYFYLDDGYYFEAGCYVAEGGDIYINALWEENTAYSLTIQKDEHVSQVYGDGLYSAGSVAHIVPSFNPGYRLDYVKDLDNGKKYYADEDPYTWNMFGDRNIKVVSKPITYQIQYQANGGAGTVYNLYCSYDNDYNLSSGGFTRPGWKLSGWKNAETGQTYGLGQSIRNLTTEQGKVITMLAVWQDITPPTIQVQDYGWTNKNVTVRPTAADQESGMKNLKLYSGSSLLALGKDTLQYAFTSDQNRTYTVIAEDNAGNTSSKEFRIKIDKTLPDIIINGQKNIDINTNWISQDSKVTVNLSDALSGLAHVKVTKDDSTTVYESSYGVPDDFYYWQMNLQKDYIRTLYQRLFFRNATDAEVNGWYSNAMNNNMQVGNIFWGLFDNQEFTNVHIHKMNDHEYIYMLYNVLLNRNPDSGGYENFMDNLAAGYPRRQAALSIYTSAEAVGLRNRYGIPTSEVYTPSSGTVYNANFDFTVTDDGVHTFKIRTVDNANNERIQYITVRVNKGGLKVSMPDYGWTNQSVQMVGSISSTISGINSVTLDDLKYSVRAYSWGGVNQISYIVPANKKYEGITNWKLTARDNAGNQAVTTNTVKIDITSPTLEDTDIRPTYNSSGQMTDVQVTVKDALSGIDTVGFYDNKNQLLYQVQGYGSLSCNLDYPFSNTDYADFYYIKAIDQAGNTYQKTILSKYTVEHYQMNPDGINYTLSDTDLYLGIPGKSYQPSLKNYEKYNSSGLQTVVVTADGKSIVKYYYSLGEVIVKFNANGGSGTMPDLVNYSPTVTLPTHTFTKENEAGQSKFMGWNTDPLANTVLYEENDQLAFLPGENMVTLYAIWDDCPLITAKDRYYTLEDAISGIITEIDLLSTVTVSDDRDSDFEGLLKVTDYDAAEYKQFTSSGSALVKYQVTDSGGNTSFTTVTVYIVNTDTEIIEDNSHVRFISEDYYQKPFAEGGLKEDSIWKTNPEYEALLEQAMENRRSLTYETGTQNVFGINYSFRKPGSISRNHTDQTWVFTPEDIKKAKEYIAVHGIGNMSEEDALYNFLIEFRNCKK